MMNAVDQKAFDVVLTRDETRLGGDMIRTGLLVQELVDRGIQLFYYFTAEQVRLDDAVSKFLLAARNFASELEREKISQRTREHLATKARKGLNTGAGASDTTTLRSRTASAERVPSPRAGKRGTGSWSPSVIHTMLRNERYRGVLLWGRVAKTYRGGTKVPRSRDRRSG